MSHTAALDPNACWTAVVDRSSAHDGAFVYGVVTTGVYCRPTCPARRPKRENVRFYRTTGDAERDGLRPCRRCRPGAEVADDPAARRIRALCAHIDRHAGTDVPLTLSSLSQRAGLSPWQLQRAFKAVVGVTPKAYLDGRRIAALKARLRGEDDVTGAIFAAGFGSVSRAYERTDAHLGMTPMAYRSGGRGVEITYAVAETSLGLLMVGATDRGVCFAQLGTQAPVLRARLAAEYPHATIEAMAQPASAAFRAWMTALTRHVEGREPDRALPVHVRATAFQASVWGYLRSIPRGTVRSYREVAAALGRPTAARAVARACASNQVALAIPCHRVIRGDGGLGGYRWGLARKRALLERERAPVSEAAAPPERRGTA